MAEQPKIMRLYWYTAGGQKWFGLMWSGTAAIAENSNEANTRKNAQKLAERFPGYTLVEWDGDKPVETNADVPVASFVRVAA